jgi:Amt family ammonium transporter
LFTVHLITTVAVIIFVAAGSYIILKITDLLTPLRVTPEEEAEGLDISQHGERL